MLNVKVILGSTRENRFSEKVLPWVEHALKTQEEIEYEVLDLRDYDFPFYDQPVSPATIENSQYAHELVRTFAGKIKEADAYLIITPEYNHGYSAVLKNALDSVYAEWNQKAIGFVSYGSVGGGRAVEQLRQVAVELQMAPIRQAVHIQAPWELRDEAGELKEGALASYERTLTSVIDQLIWWGHALKAARN